MNTKISYISQSYPHQKRIVVHRASPKTPFLKINKESFYNAYTDLNATATILYLYLVANMNEYEFMLSPQAVKNNLGMPESPCRDQINRLIEKGYLIQRAENSNIFDFYEIPREPKRVVFNKKENPERITF